MPMNVTLYSFEDVEEVLSADITPEITDVSVGPVGPVGTKHLSAATTNQINRTVLLHTFS